MASLITVLTSSGKSAYDEGARGDEKGIVVDCPGRFNSVLRPSLARTISIDIDW